MGSFLAADAGAAAPERILTAESTKGSARLIPGKQ